MITPSNTYSWAGLFESVDSGGTERFRKSKAFFAPVSKAILGDAVGLRVEFEATSFEPRVCPRGEVSTAVPANVCCSGDQRFVACRFPDEPNFDRLTFPTTNEHHDEEGVVHHRPPVETDDAVFVPFGNQE